MSTYRIKRVNEQIKRELSDLIRRHLPVEKYGLISVTEVDISKDLKTAVIFFSSVGIASQENHVLSALEKIRFTLQKELSKKVVMKYTPHLAFKQDRGMEHGQHLVDLLNSLEEGQKT